MDVKLKVVYLLISKIVKISKQRNLILLSDSKNKFISNFLILYVIFHLFASCAVLYRWVIMTTLIFAINVSALEWRDKRATQFSGCQFQFQDAFFLSIYTSLLAVLHSISISSHSCYEHLMSSWRTFIFHNYIHVLLRSGSDVKSLYILLKMKEIDENFMLNVFWIVFLKKFFSASYGERFLRKKGDFGSERVWVNRNQD